MRLRPKLKAVIMGASVELTMSPVISCHWFVKIVRPVRIFSTVILLRIVAHACQIAIRKRGGELIPKDRLHGRPSGVILPPLRMVSCVVDRLGRNFRLEDGWNGLRFSREPALHPAELRSVQGRHLHHGCVYVAMVVN